MQRAATAPFDLLAADRGVALVEERIEQVRSLGRIPRQQMVLDVSAAPTDDQSKACIDQWQLNTCSEHQTRRSCLLWMGAAVVLTGVLASTL
jgi:hypothetical protein